ncbi:MAG TPA: transposase [Polyangium sp.]|nr:transposase [Polyangium sp.]
MSQARPIHPRTTYFVTRRVERRHCLLRPDPLMNAFIKYALVVSACRYGILVHAFCAMSTHIHYVITDPHGQLPRFLAMFHRAVAIGVKTIRARDGAIWDRSQTSIVELCTSEAIIEKIAYTLANPVAAGLVRHAHEWPGVKTSIGDIGNTSLHAKRPKQWFRSDNPEWPLDATVPISVPGSPTPAEAAEFRSRVSAELIKLEAVAHALIPKNKVLGVKGVLKLNPEHRITTYEPSRQRNPTIAVGRGNREELIRAKTAVRDFRQRYRRALEAWRQGERSVVFPQGTYVMRVVHGVNVAPYLS